MVTLSLAWEIGQCTLPLTVYFLVRMTNLGIEIERKYLVIADTWTDIKDANDFVLVYDLLRADETIELTGQAPFFVFLGNGHGVEIIFNGEEIDVAPRVRDDNTARLNIK